MSDRNSPAGAVIAGRAFFSAVLTPHRSLGRRQFVLLMAVLSAVMTLGAARAVAIGAWPVAAFAALELFLVWGAFRLSYRAARAFEEVHVWPHELLVRQVGSNGRTHEHRFHPFWARLSVTRIADEGVVALAIASHGRSVIVGSFLNPADRESFAEALAGALNAVRAGELA